MRKTAILWLVLAALCGGILFQTSQRVNDGRARLADINAVLKKEDETLRVLQAEWSYLNQPERLEKLSKKYFGLAPLKGKQFGKVSELEIKPASAQTVETAEVAAPVPVPEKPALVLKPVTAADISPVFAPQPAKPRPATIKSSAWAEQPRTAGAARPAPSAPIRRDFDDVIKSLGVQ